MTVIRKLLFFPQRFILKTRTNQNAPSCTKLYRRIVPRKRTNQESIVNKHLSHNYSAEVDKLFSTEEDKSECTITEQKDAGNEVTDDVPNFNVSNIFECGRNNSDVSYERAYMATSGNEYFMYILYHLNKYHDRHGQIFFSKKLKEAVLRVMEEKEEEIECNINNITCDTSFWSPVAMNVQKKYENWSLER